MTTVGDEQAAVLAGELEQAASLGMYSLADRVVQATSGDVVRLVLSQVLRDYADATKDLE